MKKKSVDRLSTASSGAAPPSDGFGTRGKLDRGGALRLRDLLLQRQGREHRGSCEARRSAAVDARAPEHEYDDRGE